MRVRLAWSGSGSARSYLSLSVGAHVPSVLFGPGDVRVAHMPDEQVEIARVLDAARALALLIVRFCGIANTA